MPEDLYATQPQNTLIADNSDNSEQTSQKAQEQTRISWAAPARPFKRRNKEFYVTIIAIAAIFSLILFFVDGFLPVILIISVVFLFYVLSTVPPENITYKITNFGVYIADKRTDWQFLGRFWFSRRFDSELLIIEAANIGGRLEIITNPEEKTEITRALNDYIQHEEIPASRLDQAANWFSKKLPQ